MDARTRQVLMSSRSENRLTPKPLFNILDQLFHFKCDPCTNRNNPLGVEVFYTEKDNGLVKRWVDPTFLNPPFSMPVKKNGRYVRNKKGEIKRVRVIDDWIQKAYVESVLGITVVILISQRGDTAIWQDLIFPKAKVICWMRGRLHFSKLRDPSTFGSAIVIFAKKPLPRNTELVLSRLGVTESFNQSAAYGTRLSYMYSINDIPE